MLDITHLFSLSKTILSWQAETPTEWTVFSLKKQIQEFC